MAHSQKLEKRHEAADQKRQAEKDRQEDHVNQTNAEYGNEPCQQERNHDRQPSHG